MDATDFWVMVDNERSAFADLADSLAPAQWDVQSLCRRWRVRDVVAHLNEATTLTGVKAFLTLARYGFRVNTMIEREARRCGDRAPGALASEMRATIGNRRRPPGTTPEDLVMETIVHQQDVRRPLGIARSYPIGELHVALERAATLSSTLIPGKKRAAGLHLHATDLGWEHGDGADVSGPAEALLMALAGRAAALDDLTGPGVETLRMRLAS